MEKFTFELCYDGYFDMIPMEYLVPNNKIIIGLLAKYGKVELLQIAINNGCELHPMISSWGAEFGHVNVIEFAMQNKCPIDINIICQIATEHGHLEVIKWVVNHVGNVQPGFGLGIGLYACCIGHLDIVIWLYENKYINKNTIIKQMAKSYKQTAIVEWLDANEL
jgi:hypothetical protein